MPNGVHYERIQVTNLITGFVALSGTHFVPQYNFSQSAAQNSFSDNFSMGSTARRTGNNNFVITDLNSDNKPDFLITNNNALNSLVNDTSASSQPVIGDFGSSIQLASWSGSSSAIGRPILSTDFNADGNLDVLCGNSGYNGSQILLGNGNGVFTPQSSFTPQPYQGSPRVIDFENDGDIDAFGTYFHPSINFYPMINETIGGSSTISFQNTGTSNFTSDVRGSAVGDLDGDGLTDIIVSNSASLLIRPNNGSGYDDTVTLSSVQGDDIALADFDGDGLEDIITDTTSGVVVFKNTSSSGSISFDSPILISSTTDMISFDVVDFNNDNKPDLVASTSSRIYIYENTTSSSVISFSNEIQISSNSQTNSDLKVVDLNGDGEFEIITSGSNVRVQTFIAPPSLTVTQSLTDFDTCMATSSTAQSFTAEGNNLNSNISISAPSGYEVSTDNTTFSSSLTLSQSFGTVDETIIYVRLTGATTGNFNSNISVTSQDATSVDIALTGTVYESPVISGNSSIEFNTTETFTATTTPSAPAPWSSSNTTVGTITDSGEFTALALGTTTISFENSNGCIDTLEINIVDTTAPVITLTGDPTVTLEVGAAYNEQGATATDNYDTTVTVVIGGDTVDTSTVGTYTVTYDATDANNNAATQVTRTVNVVESLSVDEVNEVKLSIFPNPTSTQWNIKAKSEIKSISLYDISGRKILHERPYNKNVEINAQSLPSGVYLLSVNKTNTFRLIKL